VTETASGRGLEPVILGLEPVELDQGTSPFFVYLHRLQPGASRSTMRASLEHLADLASAGELKAELLPWHTLRYRDTAALRQALIELDYRPATVNVRLAALRGVLREAWRLELMGADDYTRARDVESVPGDTLLRGRALPAGEISALFAQVQKDLGPRGIRDNAVLALLYGCGLRRAEVVRARLVDLDLAKETLRVLGKGRRERQVAVVGGVAAALEAWLTLRGQRAGPLFVATLRTGALGRNPLSAGSIRHLCQRRAEAGQLAPFSPHDLRRSCATELLDQDVDPLTVSRLLGHSKLDSTVKYDFRAERATRRAATQLHIPRVIERAAKEVTHEQKQGQAEGIETRGKRRQGRRRGTGQGRAGHV
jgi:site-specific recombinase XerD